MIEIDYLILLIGVLFLFLFFGVIFYFIKQKYENQIENIEKSRSIVISIERNAAA